MSCSEYNFLELALGKAEEEVLRLRMLAISSGSASAMDALVGAELTKSIIASARERHVRDCMACTGTRWHPDRESQRDVHPRY